MILAKKVRLYPTKGQEKQLFKSANIARFSYNYSLSLRLRYYRIYKKSISEARIRKQITKRKRDKLAFLNEVSAQIPKQATKDMDAAFKNFFKEKKGFPRFKSKRKSRLSFFNDNVKFKVKKNLVNIEKVGWIRTKEQIPMSEKYYNPRISYDNKYWYVSVGIEYIEEYERLEDTSLGIDLGIKDLVILSNGQVFRNINKTKEVRRLKKKLKRLQRQVSRKYELNKKGGESFVKTSNILKLEQEIRLVHRTLKNIRLNHLHQVTSEIVKTKPSRIVIEDLNVKGMMKNRHLAKAVAECCFYEFRRQLEYKVKFYLGYEVTIANRFFASSKTCSSCGSYKKDLKLKDRTYICPHCGLVIDRDYNAALNLANYELA